MRKTEATEPWLIDNDTERSAREIFDWFISDGRVADVQSVVKRASSLLGFPIRVLPAGDSSWGKLTGLTLKYPDHYAILIRPEHHAHYRVHCLLHEVSHLLFGHPPSESAEKLVPSAGHDNVRHARLIAWDGEAVSASERRHEGEAEELARLLGTLVMHPRYSSGERKFG